ncbi:MAG: ABC transporter permease [Promethearchaeota archaeon]
MVKKRLVHFRSRRERFRDYVKQYFKHWHGIVGLVILIMFFLMALLAPILTFIGIFPPHIFTLGYESYIGSTYSPPQWSTQFDPLAPPTGNYIPDSSFEEDESWQFEANNPEIASYSYNETDFITGFRSVQFTIIDNDTKKDILRSSCKGMIDFEWKNKQPEEAFLICYIKVRFAGNLTSTSVYPYMKFNLPKGVPLNPTQAYFDIRPPPLSEWLLIERPLSFMTKYYVFQQDSLISVEIGVEYINDNPSQSGKVQVWFDQIELKGTRPGQGLLGKNHLGLDIFVQLFWAAQVPLFVGVFAALISVGFGLIVGLNAGYRGGRFDNFTMRICDVILIYPPLPIIFVLSAQFRASLFLLTCFIALFSWPTTARIIRSQVLVEREKGYVEAVKASGGSDWYIMLHHILPNIIGLVLVQITTSAANAILLESGLVFLDYPIFTTSSNAVSDRRTKVLLPWFSWGYMLAEAQYEGGLVQGAWWCIIPAGVCIGLLVIAFMFIGHAINKTLNPHLWNDETRKLF